MVKAGISAVSVFNNILLACIVDCVCILEDNCFCEQTFGSIVDSGEPGNESVHQFTFVKVTPSHSLSEPRPDLSCTESCAALVLCSVSAEC